MGHYAFLNEANIVTEVIVGKDENEGGINWEEHYGEFRGQVCKRTSYNTYNGVHNNGGIAFRKNYASIGYKYDESRDAFIPPQPYESWILNEFTCQWDAPVSKPDNENIYIWNESTISWDLVD
jgi:hypothetical protein